MKPPSAHLFQAEEGFLSALETFFGRSLTVDEWEAARRRFARVIYDLNYG